MNIALMQAELISRFPSCFALIRGNSSKVSCFPPHCCRAVRSLRKTSGSVTKATVGSCRTSCVVFTVPRAPASAPFSSICGYGCGYFLLSNENDWILEREMIYM